MRELLEKTDGVPLYLEEMTKAIIESGVIKEHDNHYELMGSMTSLAIPATLHDSLMARLDRLANAKGVAQLGAVIGRQFSYELLHAVSQFDEDTLQRELERLIETELIYQRGLPPKANYLFKHALIQEAAYQSLLHSTRRHCHDRILQLLETRFAQTEDAQPEILAHHSVGGEVWDKAVDYICQAGDKALARGAVEESLAWYERALAILP